jgi:hypothetical protein
MPETMRSNWSVKKLARGFDKSPPTYPYFRSYDVVTAPVLYY